MTQEIKVALLMAASLFMEILDGTIVTTALPNMARDFHTSTASISLLVSIYIITTAIFIPLSGWIADRFGKKRTWIIAVIIFSLSSLGNALAPTLPILLGMRVVQGISGALMTPTARLIVLEKAPTNQLLRMTSYLVWPALIAPAIAPVVGGAIVTYWSWHWIFLINIPIGIVIAIIGYLLVAPDNYLTDDAFDWSGFVEIAIASSAVLIGFELATHNGFTSILGLIMAAIGFFLTIPIYRHLKRSTNPLFSVDALRFTSFRISQTSGFILWLSVGAMPFLLTIFLQNGFHWSAIKAGTYVIFIFLGNIGIKPFTTPIIRKLTYKGALQLSFALVLLSSFALALMTPKLGIVIMFLAFISGVGRSLALTAFNGLNLSEVAPQDRSSANTLNAVVQTLAQGIGISLISVAIHFLNLHFNLTVSYRLGFILLGIIIIFPIIETSRISKKLGLNTLS